ncbi:MAG TPA: TM0106 family RecB-like putative nuclease [Gammaproteobacteria bacterium]|nr:TM0106 family RecB-like putative nuclease [Gammaproteobacteria bacterium]
MQKNNDGQYLFSASDLVNFLECHHLTFLDFHNLADKILKSEDSSVSKLLKEKGHQHESDYLESLGKQGKTIFQIPKDLDLGERVKLTKEALQSGAAVVYQGVFYKHPWRGDADFLIKIDKPSRFGSFSYEVVDTKLARNPKPKHIMQLCAYTSLLEDAQGVKPELMHLVLGDGKQVSFKFDDFSFYYLQAKHQFESYMASPPVHSYPEPCKHCSICHWRDHCIEQWESDNHLSLVANIQRSQIDKLEKAQIKTVSDLASLAADTIVSELNPDVFKRLQAQANLQIHKLRTGENKYEILTSLPGCGFERMPKPDTGDIFFDMEGDPLYPNGLEYLFGIYFVTQGSYIFKTFWAHNHEQERETFKEFMTFIGDHIQVYPNAHIYHYNHYETSALKRLACRYGIAEEQIDNLLRQDKFVDLYKVVRESIRTSEPGYSIKNLETFYMEKREGSVATATDSIVVYNLWCETKDQKLLDEIAAYNEIDCVSTLKLRDWLLSLRSSDMPWFTGKNNNTENETVLERKDWEVEYESYRHRLLDGVSEDEKPLRELLFSLLEFHRRENKPQWWASFERRDKFEYELIDDPECLGGLTLMGKPMPEKRSLIYTYHFLPQEYKFNCYDSVVNVATMKAAGTIVELNNDECTVKLKRGVKDSLPERLSIGPSNPIDAKSLREAIYRVADSILQNQHKYMAVLDILNKAIPRIKGKNSGESIVGTGELQINTLAAIANLNESYLFIQGPPGAGKTHTSAHVIVELIRQGKKVGVTANSHKAIHNLLDKIEEVALEENFSFTGIKWGSKDDEDTHYTKRCIRSETTNKDDCLNVALLAGTAWLFSDNRFDSHLDYLFVDEAGQVSIANVVVMGTAAKNIILVGDQMQLGQPIKGVHPGNAGKSILEFLLEDHATIPPERGIFLNNTRRLHPSICKFISAAFYDGRLNADSGNEQRCLVFDKPIEGITSEGIHIVAANHTGCSQKSEEEGVVIKKLYNQVILQKLRYQNGTRDLNQDDILVVTPYNVQVNYLKSILPPGARVGTVDKFQGQEAPIVLVSMVTSSEEDLPRNIEFLYSKNRLNVALSRAKCLAVVVVNKNLLEIPCKTIEQMKLVNTFCWLSDFTTHEDGPAE